MFDKDLNRRALENLIRCGAFDNLGARRSQLLQVMNRVMDSVADSRKRNLEGQLDLFGGLGESQQAEEVPLPDLPEFTRQELLNMERESTGLYLSGHPMDAYREQTRRLGVVKMGAIVADFAQETGPERFQDRQKVRLAGVISSVRLKATRNQTMMAYVNLEDDTGSMELLVFSRTLSQCEGFLVDGQVVLVEGSISVRDEKAPQLLCDQIQQMEFVEELSPPPVRPHAIKEARKLYLRLPTFEKTIARRIENILLLFPGQQQLILYCEDTQKRFGLPCMIHTSMVQEFRDLLGEDNVVVK